jgi:hypothetical protein
VLFDQYSGRLFAAVIELSLAARGDPELATVVATEERSISLSLQETAATIFGADALQDHARAALWSTILSAIRGLALLKLLGHTPSAVDRQWRTTRGQLLGLLGADAFTGEL